MSSWAISHVTLVSIVLVPSHHLSPSFVLFMFMKQALLFFFPDARLPFFLRIKGWFPFIKIHLSCFLIFSPQGQDLMRIFFLPPFFTHSSLSFRSSLAKDLFGLFSPFSLPFTRQRESIRPKRAFLSLK